METKTIAIIVTLCVLMAIGVYFAYPKYIKPYLETKANVTQPPTPSPTGKSDDDFIASNTFTGKKPGYVFKNDEQGIGYYKDEIEMEKLK